MVSVNFKPPPDQASPTFAHNSIGIVLAPLRKHGPYQPYTEDLTLSKEADLKAARAMLADKSITVEDVAKRLRVSTATLYRHLPAARTEVDGA